MKTIVLLIMISMSFSAFSDSRGGNGGVERPAAERSVAEVEAVLMLAVRAINSADRIVEVEIKDSGYRVVTDSGEGVSVTIQQIAAKMEELKKPDAYRPSCNGSEPGAGSGFRPGVVMPASVKSQCDIMDAIDTAYDNYTPAYEVESVRWNKEQQEYKVEMYK